MAGTRLEILVVDDDDDMRAYMGACLAGLAPRRLLEARGAAEALQTLVTARPDLIITDVAMPGIDGLALCRMIRADAALARIPILIVTGLVAIETYAAWADAVLSKPFNAATLQRVVQGTMNQREL